MFDQILIEQPQSISHPPVKIRAAKNQKEVLNIWRPKTKWDLIIVGGGPAAALQVQTAPPGTKILVASPSLGGGTEMLGQQRMQSYLDELSISPPDLSLCSYTEPGSVSPTGTQYARYVRDVIRSSNASFIPLTMADVWPQCGVLKVSGYDSKGVAIILQARSVVLATGCRPKPPPFFYEANGVLSHEAVYWDIARSQLDKYRGKPVFIIGSGNTAMQLAACLAATNLAVTILANKYPGIYPQETDDRFAWRAPSQRTCELVAKTALRSSSCEPQGMAVRFIIYDELTVSRGWTIEFSYCRARNDNTLGCYSLPPYHPKLDRFRKNLNGDRWLERYDLKGATLISAIGVDPAYPEGPTLRTLKRDTRGYICHAEGRTPMPGLCVSGICAGFPAVNFMRIPQIDHLIQFSHRLQERPHES